MPLSLAPVHYFSLLCGWVAVNRGERKELKVTFSPFYKAKSIFVSLEWSGESGEFLLDSSQKRQISLQ